MAAEITGSSDGSGAVHHPLTKIGTQTDSPMAIDGFSDEYKIYLIVGANLKCADNSFLDSSSAIVGTVYNNESTPELITDGWDGLNDQQSPAILNGRFVLCDLASSSDIGSFNLWMTLPRETSNYVMVHGTSSSMLYNGGSEGHGQAYSSFSYTLDWTDTTPATENVATSRKVTKFVLQAVKSTSISSTTVTGDLRLFGIE